MLNKRGQGLSTNAIVLIILAVIVLVVLIMGFTLGWNRLAPWISGNNVDAVVNSCSVACSTDNIYEFCTLQRALRAEDLPGGVDEIENTCQFFSTDSDYELYGIAKCPGLCD